MEYVVFTDESNITASRYQSLAAFSLLRSNWDHASQLMSEILTSSDVSEFKWKKFNNAKYFYCAEKMINFIFEHLHNFKIRIDVLIWDTQDSRHEIQGRDDLANYERMFYHLLNGSMRKRPKNASWHIRPDQRGGIDWDTIRDCLSARGNQQEYSHTIFGHFFSDPYYSITTFNEQDSKIELLIQIADLFSGLAVYSKTAYNQYKKWELQQTPSLFGNVPEKFTNREEFRFKLLQRFNHKCKAGKLGVSLDSNQCLYTFDQKKPINFWHYETQHELDKAPTRGVKNR